jgi:small ligand-binding sensory domain FIST
MLQFFSASTNIVNSKKAIAECLENALQGEPDLNCDLLILFTAMGHNFRELLTEAHNLSQDARIIGCTGAGIIGSKGPDESKKALAIMAIKGLKNEFAVSCIDSTTNSDPYDVGVRLAEDLKKQNPEINMILFYPSTRGMYFGWEKAIAGIESVFGPDIPVIGGIASDGGRFVSDFQFFDDKVLEQGAVMAGFADPTLELLSLSNHGLDVIGTPFEVTRSVENHVYELDGKPAWISLTDKLGLPVTTSPLEIFPFASIVKEIPEIFREEYDSKYIVAAAPIPDSDGSIYTTVLSPVGTKLWLTKRNEQKIFDGVDQMVTRILKQIGTRKPVAVLHADCTTRGKFSFDRIVKDKIIGKLQTPLCKGEKIPWAGIYASGQIAPLCGRNMVHFYTSSLFIMVRPKV